MVISFGDTRTGAPAEATFRHLLSEDAEVAVFVDDEPLGSIAHGSATFSMLEAGSHVVRFDRAGDAAVTQRVDVEPGSRPTYALHAAGGTPEVLVTEADAAPSSGLLVRVIHTGDGFDFVEASTAGVLPERLGRGELGSGWMVAEACGPNWVTFETAGEPVGLSFLLPCFPSGSAVEVWLTTNRTDPSIPERPFVVLGGAVNARVGHDPWAYFVHLAGSSASVDLSVDEVVAAAAVGPNEATGSLLLRSETGSYDVGVLESGGPLALATRMDLPLETGRNYVLALIGDPGATSVVAVSHASTSAPTGSLWASLLNAVTERPLLTISVRQAGADVVPARTFAAAAFIDDLSVDAGASLEVLVDGDGDGVTDQTLVVPGRTSDFDMFLVRPDRASDAVELRVVPATGGTVERIAI